MSPGGTPPARGPMQRPAREEIRARPRPGRTCQNPLMSECPLCPFLARPTHELGLEWAAGFALLIVGRGQPVGPEVATCPGFWGTRAGRWAVQVFANQGLVPPPSRLALVSA